MPQLVAKQFVWSVSIVARQWSDFILWETKTWWYSDECAVALGRFLIALSMFSWLAKVLTMRSRALSPFPARLSCHLYPTLSLSVQWQKIPRANIFSSRLAIGCNFSTSHLALIVCSTSNPSLLQQLWAMSKSRPFVALPMNNCFGRAAVSLELYEQ